MTVLVRPIACALASIAVLSLSACVVAPAHRVYPAPAPQVVYPQPVPVPQSAPPVTVYQAPPPPQQEVYGVAPGPGYFWIGGVWLWEGNRHVWRPGHWEQHRPGRAYVPHAWVRAGNGWQIHGGHWR